MAERKTKPVAKKAASIKAAGTSAAKPRILRAASVMAPQKTAAKKPAPATGKPARAITPAAKKAIVPVAAKKAAAQKVVASSARPAAKKIMVAQPTPEERYRMVQTAAYFIAERNGFSGCPTEYWAAAELEITGRLGR